LVGTGELGEALLSGRLGGAHEPADLVVTAGRPERAAQLQERHGVAVLGNVEAAEKATTLLLAVKPQDMGALLDEIAETASSHQLVISVAAGITTAFLERRLAPGTP